MKKDRSIYSISRYWPLFVILAIAFFVAFALTHRMGGGSHSWMHFFMGMLFCQFAALKLFHVADFAEGFQMYDLIAQKVPYYGSAYPFIELFLGLAYFGFFLPKATYIFTIILMAVSAFSVIRALRAGLDVRCACMGTILNVPLSTVTLTEDIGMGFMALLLLLGY